MNHLETLTRDLRARGAKPVVPFLTAGYPDAATCGEVLAAIADAGCPLVEIGIPFSDPVADGPVIQAASQVALSGGMTLPRTLDLATSARRDHGLAVVLMGYLNPILRMGPRAFAAACADAKIAGVIVPDLPLEESAGLRDLLDQVGVDLVNLVAPTTDDERLRRCAATATGFLYLVSTTGVTGTAADEAGLDRYVARVRQASDLPLYVGFGISRAQQAAHVAAAADGAIVGSALLRLLTAGDEATTAGAAARRLVEELWAAMNPPKGTPR